MALKKFKFEFEICPDREGNNDKLISLEVKNGKYYLGYNHGNDLIVFDISSKVDVFCQGLIMMNINEWNQKCFDEPMDFFPGYFWKLTIIADDINVVCKGKDNLPKNWNEFKALLCEIGIADRKFPFG